MEYLRPWLRLQLTPGLGRLGLTRLITHYKTPGEAIEAARKSWPKLPGLRHELAALVPDGTDPRVERALNTIMDIDGWICTFWDEDYPQELRSLPDPPAILYGCGSLPGQTALAIVGSRHPTHTGRVLTEQLAEELAAAGVIIISGLARGIDTAAHRGALRGKGKTVAVLGCGLDCIYPPENQDLFWQITEQGAVISEYPPGTAPLPGHFPGRNRIISGLSRGTLVVEAARNSGSLITAEFALEQGREVLAVPGGIDHETSYGPNSLIKQGAHPVTETSEILQVLGLGHRATGPRRGGNNYEDTLEEPFCTVLSIFDQTPRHCDEVASQSGLTAMELSAILLHLELQGFIEKLPGGLYIRTNRYLNSP